MNQAQNNLNVVAVDQVQEEIDYLNENHKEENILFVCDDFTNLANTSDDIINETDFDYIYSRFTFHSINEANMTVMVLLSSIFFKYNIWN